MRRSDRMVTDRKRLERALREAPVCRVAWNGSPFPYVVPLNFVYERGTLYFHCAHEGEKLERLRADPHVCVEVDEQLAVRAGERACSWATSYRSVIARGVATIVNDPARKTAALRSLVAKYSGRADWDLPAGAVAGVTVVAVELLQMSGKEA